MKIAFLGPKGSYSHLAAQLYAFRYFKKTLCECSCVNFEEVIKKVENKKADFALIPIENTNSGSINEVYDLLQKTNLHITGEIILPVKHCILVSNQTKLQKIETIYSHPQPFQQCSKFINLFPNWKIKYTKSTSEAMKKVSYLKSTKVAALGSKIGGNFYQLKSVLYNLSNQRQNHTRFIILSKKEIHISKHIPAKTTFTIKTTKERKILIETLLILQKYKLTMSKLEYRPINNDPLKEMFYFDIQGHLQFKKMQLALKILKTLIPSLKILGCYPSEKFKKTILETKKS